MLIGGGGEKVTLKLVAQYGDACNVNGDIATLKHKFDVIKQHCETVGRDYESIRRTASVVCAIGETEEQAQSSIPEPMRRLFGDRIQGALIGTPDTLRPRLAEYEAAGVQELLVTFADRTNLDSIQLFAKEFIA